MHQIRYLILAVKQDSHMAFRILVTMAHFGEFCRRQHSLPNALNFALSSLWAIFGLLFNQLQQFFFQ